MRTLQTVLCSVFKERLTLHISAPRGAPAPPAEGGSNCASASVTFTAFYERCPCTFELFHEDEGGRTDSRMR